MAFLCLSIHADYACRHSGACCNAWFVPAESHVVELVTSGRLKSVDTTQSLFISAACSSGGMDTRLAHGHGGTCVFRQNQRCSIHSHAGASALPTSCRHYPRVLVRDEFGTRVCLSHYCPTAASLLTTGRDPHVLEAGANLRVDDPVEGLDARDALPPLCRPGMLTDLAGYYAWEAGCIGALAHAGEAVRALNVIGRATEVVRSWTPSRGTLADTVTRAFVSAESDSATNPAPYARAGGEIVRTLVSHAPPAAEVPLVLLSKDLERIITNYLAARVFGNWICYQGQGLRTIVAWLHACHELVRAFAAGTPAATTADLLSAVRSADFLMLHTLDSQAFARAALVVEH